MTENVKMNKNKEQIYLGKTIQMVKAGYALDEIVSALNQPIELVTWWSDIYNERLIKYPEKNELEETES